jgi:hypothetical protein
VNARLSALAAVVLASLVSACGGGGGDDLLNEDALRNCLADAGLGATPPPGATRQVDFAPVNLRTAPDFTAYAADGAIVDVVVEGSEDKARRTAADVSGTLRSLGVTDASDRLVARANAIAVFHRAASTKHLAAVRSCMD